MPKLDDRKGTDVVTAQFVITIHENGSLEIAGPIDNYEYAMAVLDNAKDAIRNHHNRKGKLIVPPYDVSIPKP